ncbi:cellulase family glycosylhydrolase [Cohnella sp. CFH 77786]|uniref:cellulase family glycosylhydrolase n=1 Tax=Cohnella sp. CFH 77786 TaxID=2662265 RepID=UPI001C60BE3D|nr:cellulase family glycosylhydrolase [Cohnella sp. CFH 77786]MBW5447177.1 cellulase family glycosylhydrolase [Cohnella sp. CFH 77786]
MKKTKKLLSLAMASTVALTTLFGHIPAKAETVNTETASQQYIDAMGKGWNLGNTLEAIAWGDAANSSETTWGQPVVTAELFTTLKAKGFDSVRIPFSSTPGSIKDSSGHYVISQTRLARYKQVVDWAVAAGLYVQLDPIHDIWNFLSDDYFDGDMTKAPFLMFEDFWKQLADTFKDEPNQVCFETSNEPSFKDEKDSAGKVTISAQDKLDMTNQAAYDIIRNSGGNNATRMIVIPAMWTNYTKTAATYSWISAKNDPNLIATVHWYSDWVFAAQIGKTGFDEELFSDRPGYTPRVGDQVFFDEINNNLISKGVGVIIGEYALMSYDMQEGEQLKYFEDVNAKAAQYKAAPMLWDVDILNRVDFTWKTTLPGVGAVLDAANKGERSSYSTGLNEIYLSKPVDNDVQIPLTLNGNTFTGINGLTAGTDYTYNAATATVTLSKAYVNSKFNALGVGNYGNISDLVFKFSAGADWHQYLIKYSSPVLKSSTGTTSGVKIPVDFNGAKLRRAYSVNVNADGTDGSRVGELSAWWPWLKYGRWSEVVADYNNNTININSNFFQYAHNMQENGKIKFYFEFYDGQTVNYILTKSGSNVTGEAPNTAPVTTIAINPATPNGNEGWYTSGVTVSLTTNDNSSSVAKTEYSLDGSTWQTYTAPFTLNTDGLYSVSYRSTDISGNVETVQSISFKLDLTGPTITATDVVNGTYNDSSDITPVITLDDKFSGVDASKTTVTLDGKAVQQGVAIQLYTLPLGSHTFTVTASDLAGNISTKEIVFQITTSIQSLKDMVTSFKNAGWIDNAGIANSLQSKLNSNALTALVNEVKAQSGKHISAEAADILIRDAQYLLSQATGQ